MLDSYFFVPADNTKFLAKAKNIDSNFIVYDLEDAVPITKKKIAYQNIMSTKIVDKSFVRIPFTDNYYSNNEVKQLIEKFEGRVVLPKIESSESFSKVLDIEPNLKSILLVESPLALINLRDIVLKHASCIIGIGFGSHDFCSIMAMEHTNEFLFNYKQKLMLICKAYDIKYIDGVNLDIQNFDTFREECLQSFKLGVDSKFMIHPKQIEELKKVDFLTQREMDEIKQVNDLIDGRNIDDCGIIKFRNKIYERPHLIRIKQLAYKIKQFYGSK